ncbi:DUF6233 domain-containing protein [Streptomyces sp. CBG33]|uniref:DUF6233 domain-containing protein n=1 Tax=Streptomyces sp. CBG33 TaxID=2762624 RepID=UPI00164562FD|nr:DUF6233 domain-containing protein [Streptomyces sp. CBG33]
MNDRLSALLFLRRVQEQDLARTDRWIEVEQQRQAEEERRRERARPEPPEWVLELGIGDGSPPIAVHAGDCVFLSKRRRPVSADEARRLIVDGTVGSCDACRPDTVLGLVE